MEQEKKPSYQQRWRSIRASKTVVFWIIIGVIIATMVVGFNWGGWVTGASAQRTANTTAKDALVQRLATICVGQFDQDPQKAQKLIELQETRAYQQDDYVADQGWATMPGDEKPDNGVANECAKLILEINK